MTKQVPPPRRPAAVPDDHWTDHGSARPRRGPRFDETTPAYIAGKEYAANREFGRGLLIGGLAGLMIGLIVSWRVLVGLGL